MKYALVIIVILAVWFILSPVTSTSTSREPVRIDSGNFYEDNASVYDEDSNYESLDEDYVTSDNWECTSDCSGHEAGYDWALENDITDSSDCGGNSNSFIEGCEAYANEYLMEQEQEYDDYGSYDDYSY